MPKKVPIQPYERPIHYEKYKRKESLSPVTIVFLLVAIWYVLIGKDILPKAIKNLKMDNTQEVMQQKTYYEFTCSEANFARMVGLILGEEIEDTEEEAESLWYEKYYRVLEELGVKSLKKEEAFTPLSGKKLQQVVEELFDNSQLDPKLGNKEQLDLYEVVEAFSKVLEGQSQSITYETLTILATPSDELQLEPWQLASDKGKFYFEGLVVDPIKNQTLQVAVWNDYLLGVMEIKETGSVLKGCKIVSIEEEKISFEIAGQSFTYELGQELPISSVGEVGEIKIEEGKVTAFNKEVSQQVDTLVSITKDSILLEKAGSFAYDEVSVYDQTDVGTYTSLESLPYGVHVAYTVSENKITSLEVIGQSLGNAIRVVLTSSGNYVQKEVTLVGRSDYDLIYEGKASTLAKGTVWNSETFDWKEDKVVRIVPRTDSVLTLNSLVKGQEAPSYKGILEIKKTDEGYILVNEVDLENYVAGVIPSEMPTSYEIEALKAQAVAARTYAAASLSSSKYMAYGAHVDDTTASQVYNTIPANETSYKAARETAGLVLKSEGKLISNKFFAASCGYTANYGEVWAGQNYPGNSPSYLVARQQYLGDQLVDDLQNEEDFKSFIELTAEDVDAFDETSPWFRWQVQLSKEELEGLIMPALKKIGNSQPNLVSYESKAGKKLEAAPSDLGEISKLKVEKRGEGGNLMVLGIYCEKGNVKVSTEYLIRSLFASNSQQGLTVIRSNQSKVEQMSLLPSAFFTIEEKQDDSGNLQSVTLIGGGNGHGVGLSQDGANGMAKRGYTFKEILSHYYKSCELVAISG